jgi:dephospho-CoA kinase
MLKVGLTGGYATGKSFVAKELERLGCFVLYADKLGHQALYRDGAAFAPTLALFGKTILAADGTIDRKKLGAIVFSSPPLLQQLNDIVHPAVFQLETQAINGFESQNPHGIAVVEAAILIETGRHRHYDKLIVTTCEIATQIARGIQRDHLSEAEVVLRLSKQLPAADRIRFADYVISTEHPPAETLAAVQRLYRELRQLAEAPPS